MNLTTARSILVECLSTVTNQWSTTQQDFAIQGAARYANEQIGILRKKSTVNTVASNSVIDLTTGEPDFFPTNWRHGRVSSGGTTSYDPVYLRQLDWIRMQLEADTGTRQPKYIGFETPASGLLYPTPDAAYTITFIWIQDIVSWTAGTASPDGVTFNIPDRLMMPILQYGGAAILTRSWPRNKSAVPNWSEFQEWVEETKGTYGSDEGGDVFPPDDD